jgi:hypothetical protein
MGQARKSELAFISLQQLEQRIWSGAGAIAVSGNVNRFPQPEHLNLRLPGEPLNRFPQFAQDTIIAAVPPSAVGMPAELRGYREGDREATTYRSAFPGRVHGRCCVDDGMQISGARIHGAKSCSIGRARFQDAGERGRLIV